nr:TraR/DksA C4-type zinc finger protein [Vogesella sp. EB]
MLAFGLAGASHCADCGEPIPHKRQQAAPGCTRCVDCQSTHERPTR